jgi:hypothetical protein
MSNPLDCGTISTLETPNQIRFYRVASARAAVKLEKAGMRHSRIRGGLRKLWGEHYGLGSKPDYDALIQRMTEELMVLKQEIANERAQQQFPL